MILPADAKKGAAVEAMFDRIAHRYDLMNRLMTLGIDRSWRRRTIASLDLRRGDLVLDLACGTGDLAREAIRAGGRVVGLDFSAGMLRKAAARRVGCALVRGDALRMPFPDGTCDAIVSGFALRNFVNLKKALRECARVLKPGGKVAFLEVDRPRNRLLQIGHRIYFDRIVPWIGKLVADAEAYAYLPASVVYLPDERQMIELLRKTGFEALGKEQLLGGVAQLLTARRAKSSGSGNA